MLQFPEERLRCVGKILFDPIQPIPLEFQVLALFVTQALEGQPFIQKECCLFETALKLELSRLVNELILSKARSGGEQKK